MSQRLMYGIGQICDELGQKDSRVRRIIATRGIQPVGIVGTSRVFTPEAVNRIRKEIEEIDEVRAKLRGPRY